MTARTGYGTTRAKNIPPRLPIWGLTCGYFRDLWTEKSKLASMLVFWSPRGPRVPMSWGGCVGAAGYPMGCQIGRLTRHETPLRLARPSQATKISKPNRFAYPSRSRPRGVYRPLWLIWHRPRHLVIEIRQIWGWVSAPVSHRHGHVERKVLLDNSTRNSYLSP